MGELKYPVEYFIPPFTIARTPSMSSFDGFMVTDSKGRLVGFHYMETACETLVANLERALSKGGAGPYKFLILASHPHLANYGIVLDSNENIVPFPEIVALLNGGGVMAALGMAEIAYHHAVNRREEIFSRWLASKTALVDVDAALDDELRQAEKTANDADNARRVALKAAGGGE